jgi:hypothetical protein
LRNGAASGRRPRAGHPGARLAVNDIFMAQIVTGWLTIVKQAAMYCFVLNYTAIVKRYFEICKSELYCNFPCTTAVRKNQTLTSVYIASGV